MSALTTDIQTKEAQSKAEHLHIRASERDKKTLAQAARIKNLSISQFLCIVAGCEASRYGLTNTGLAHASDSTA